MSFLNISFTDFPDRFEYHVLLQVSSKCGGFHISSGFLWIHPAWHFHFLIKGNQVVI